MDDEIDLALVGRSADAARRTAVWVDPTGASIDWWLAPNLAWLPATYRATDPTRDPAAAGQQVTVTLIADAEPLADGNGAIERGGFGTPDRTEVTVPATALLRRFSKDDFDERAIRRDQQRIVLGLPRYVVRSDHYRTRPKHAFIHPWPAGMFAQGGTTRLPGPDGTKGADGPEGVFIEISPRDPRTFVRGEGETYAEAEDRLWERWQKIVACPGHEYETRGYRNGAGFCRLCDLFTARAFDLTEIGSTCVICGIGTNWSHVPRLDADGKRQPGRDGYDMACEQHAPPSYHDIDAHMSRSIRTTPEQDGVQADEDTDPMDTPLTADQEQRLRGLLPTGRDWSDLPFEAKWTAAGRLQRALVDETIAALRA